MINHVGQKRLRGLAPVLFLTCLMAFIGGWQHLLFSYEIGEATYFKSAYDEDFYGNQDFFAGPAAFYRLTSQFLFDFLSKILISSEAILVFSDFLLPILLGCAVWLFSKNLTVKPHARLLASIFIIFSPDLLSMGNTAVWTSTTFNLTKLQQVLSEFSWLLPDYNTSFLMVSRTPEPVTSLCFMFLQQSICLVTLKRVDNGRRISFLEFLILLFASVGLTFSYVFVSIPAFGLTLLMAFYLCWNKYFVEGFQLLIALLISLLAAAIFFQIFSGSSVGGSLIFQSRLPVLTPAVILGFAMMSLWLVRILTMPRATVLDYYGMVLGLVPIGLSNYQVLTGYMVSARDWERSTSYIFLSVSIILLIIRVLPRLKAYTFHKFLTICLILFFVSITVNATLNSYLAWRPYNLKSVAIARLLEKIGNEHNPHIYFWNSDIVSIVALRSNHKRLALSFNSVFSQQPPLLRELGAGTSIEKGPHADAVYRYWYRKQISPDSVGKILTNEAKQKSGFYSAFFFNFLDFWYPASDNRAVKTRDIVRTIPKIQAQYSILSENPPASWNRPIWVVSENKLRDSLNFSYEEIGNKSIGNDTFRLYIQRRNDNQNQAP